MHTKDVPIERVREMFEYDPKTGVVTSKSTGLPTGHINQQGYMQVSVRPHGQKHSQGIHRARVAWALYYGRWPEHTIDHINRVRHDDRICNLRDVTNDENTRNREMKPGQSGFRNVHFGLNRHGNPRWFVKFKHGAVRKKLSFQSKLHAALMADRLIRKHKGTGFQTNLQAPFWNELAPLLAVNHF